jgi:hypothetical protein
MKTGANRDRNSVTTASIPANRQALYQGMTLKPALSVVEGCRKGIEK